MNFYVILNVSFSHVNELVNLWRDHTGPNAFRMLSEYECSVYFRNCPNALRIGLLHRMLSVCFPNDFSMLSEQAEYFPHVHIDRFPPRTFSV